MRTIGLRILSLLACGTVFGAPLKASELNCQQTSGTDGQQQPAAHAANSGTAISDQTTSSSQPSSRRLSGTADVSVDAKPLQGKIVATNTSPDVLIDNLVESALAHNEVNAAIEQREKKYAGNVRRTVTKVSDMAEFMTAYKGFQASSEAADVILDEKLKLKSKAAVEYLKQKNHDELHAQVVSSLMQVASGLGIEDPARRNKSIQAGVTNLNQLVGPEEANRALNSMTAWAMTVKDGGPSKVDNEPWDVLRQNTTTKKLIESSLETDPVIEETRNRLHKFNHRTKFMMATAKILNTSLSVAAFSPTFVSPAAQIALISFLMATGGPEEAKLLRELYLDRRINARYKMISEEASLSVNNLNVSSITGNNVLNQFCRTTIYKMIGNEFIAESLLSSHDPPVDLTIHGSIADGATTAKDTESSGSASSANPADLSTKKSNRSASASNYQAPNSAEGQLTDSNPTSAQSGEDGKTTAKSAENVQL